MSDDRYIRFTQERDAASLAQRGEPRSALNVVTPDGLKKNCKGALTEAEAEMQRKCREYATGVEEPHPDQTTGASR